MSQDEIQRSLGKIEATLEAILDRLDTHDEVRTKTTDRVDALERWRAYLSGAWFILAAGLAYLIKGDK